MSGRGRGQTLRPATPAPRPATSVTPARDHPAPTTRPGQGPQTPPGQKVEAHSLGSMQAWPAVRLHPVVQAEPG